MTPEQRGLGVRSERLTVFAVRSGIAIPILYFGMQLLAAPFYPGYSFISRDASTLGSDGSSVPAIFNLGSILVGLVELVAAWGFLRAFLHEACNEWKQEALRLAGTRAGRDDDIAIALAIPLASSCERL